MKSRRPSDAIIETRHPKIADLETDHLLKQRQTFLVNELKVKHLCATKTQNDKIDQLLMQIHHNHQNLVFGMANKYLTRVLDDAEEDPYQQLPEQQQEVPTIKDEFYQESKWEKTISVHGVLEKIL